MKATFIHFFCVLTLSMTAAWATDNHEYGPDEYVTITDGTSPNGKYAITAHGGGDYGYENFHIYLTNAKNGKAIGHLEQLDDCLDTGAGAFCAMWSKNSQELSVFYRISRQKPIQQASYRIDKGRVILTKGPDNVTDEYSWYWYHHCSYIQKKGKTFGTPLQH